MKRKANLTVLHIGPHKTGSTALQNFCNQNQDYLWDNGILYFMGPQHGMLGSYVSENPLEFIYNVHSGRMDPELIRSEDLAFVDALKSHIDAHKWDTVIFSYEGFFSLNKKEVERLAEFLRNISHRQLVVFYFREPLSFATSEISQRARMGLPSEIDEDSPDHSLPVLTYADNIPAFVDAFGRDNVLARKYTKKDLVNGSVVDDFFCATRP